MAEITLDREVLIYISNIDGALFPDNNLYPDDDLYPGFGTLIIESSEGNSGIVEGSLNIEELIVDSNLIFGQCISNKFECVLYNIPYDIAGKDILVVALENGTQIPLFKGKIDSSVTDNTSYERNLVAYDEFYYKRDKNVAEWWNEYWTGKTSSSLKEIRNSLLNFIDIPFYEKELVNDDTVIKSTSTYSVLSFGDCLKMICELQGCFPNIDRTGTLDFVVLGENEINVSEGYEKNNAQFQDYKTTKITGIMVYSDATEITHTVGSTENMYAITSNIFLEEMSAPEVNTCVGNLLNAIKDIEYIPCDIPMILSDLEVEIGSKIVVDDKVTYALKNAYFGSLIVNQNITANASSENQTSTPDVVSSDKSIGRKISKVEHDLDGFRVEVGDEIDKTNSRLDVVAGQISAKVDYGDYTASVIIGKINDETPSGVQIEADKINLNGYVTVTDLKTSGSTIINGSNITTGSISCNRLNGGTITGQKIIGGTINGATISCTSSDTNTTANLANGMLSFKQGSTNIGNFSGANLKILGIFDNKMHVIAGDNFDWCGASGSYDEIYGGYKWKLPYITKTIDIDVSSANGVLASFPNSQSVSLHATPSNSNHGLYSNSQSKWIAYMNTSGTTLTTTSDKRAKIDKGILSAEEAVDILTNINIVKFVMKDDVNENNLEQSGIYAQDLRDYLLQNNYNNRGYIVLQENDENANTSYDITQPESNEFTYTVDYTKFIPLLIKGWQEQKKEIDALKDRVNELTNLVNKLLNIGG